MNTETGQIYRGEAEIAAARRRGEPIVPVSERVANLMEGGNRKQRRAARFGGKDGRVMSRTAQRKLAGWR